MMEETTIFNHGRVIWQTTDPDVGIPEVAIAAHVDNDGTIVLEQEGRSIVLNERTVPDLARALWDLRRAVHADRIRKSNSAGGKA